jgi:hypothetical protein
MDMALLFFGFLWALLGGKGGKSTTSSPAPSGGNGGLQTSTPPWPQVVPSGLPPFPGSGWEFDEPPPPEVHQRAAALVNQLWARGAGTWKTELTAGRWITYQAQIVSSGRKGVVAYRQRRAPSSSPPSARTAARPVSSPPAPVASAPAAMPMRVSPVALPTLRVGRGLKPAAPDPDVRLLQERLRLGVDGRFGPGTRAAVVAYQQAHGLEPDGVVGPVTWSSLFATTSA